MQFSLICSALVRRCLTEVIRTIPVLTRVLCGRSICVPRRRNSAGFRPARTLFTFRRRGSMRKWRNCNVLHSVWSPPFLLRNTQFLMVSRLKAPSRRDTAVSSCRVHVFIAECYPFCAFRRAWNMLGRVRLGWLRGLERQELFIFPVAHGDSAGLRPTRTDLSSHELEEKVARLHLLALGAELTASAMKREDTMQAVDGSVVLVLESCCQR